MDNRKPTSQSQGPSDINLDPHERYSPIMLNTVRLQAYENNENYNCIGRVSCDALPGDVPGSQAFHTYEENEENKINARKISVFYPGKDNDRPPTLKQKGGIPLAA